MEGQNSENPVQPSSPTQSAAPVQSPKKGGSAATIIIIVIVVLVVLGVGGYFVQRFVVRKASEKLTETLVGGVTGGKVDVSSNGEGFKYSGDQGSLEVGPSAKWPTDMPANVPKFTYGTVTASSKTPEGWSVIFEKVTTDAQTKYLADLTGKGWTQDGEAIDMGATKITQVTDGKNTLTVLYDASSGGASLTVAPKS